MTAGEAYHPGQEFGLPERGSGSVAPYARRAVAFLLDFSVLTVAIWLDPWWTGLALVVVAFLVLPERLGVTPGQAALWLRTVPVIDGEVLHEQRGLTLTTAFGRCVIWLCLPLNLLIAAVSLDRDRRTGFDRATRTIVLNR